MNVFIIYLSLIFPIGQQQDENEKTSKSRKSRKQRDTWEG